MGEPRLDSNKIGGSMKSFLMVLTLVSFQFSNAASSVQEQAIPVMLKSVLAGNPPSAQDPACPAAGYQVVNPVETGNGKAVSSSTTIVGMINSAAGQREKLQNDTTKCGPCKQANLVSTFSTSAPSELRSDVTCAAPFARNFQHDFNNPDIESYATDILRGKNPEGAKLNSNCPDSCSLYTASAQTPLTASTSRLDMTVFCGPQKQGNILFAIYNLTVGFVHQWSCSSK